jgi:hypothetical protein
MNDAREEWIYSALEKIHPRASSLERIEELPIDNGKAIVSCMLEFACLAQSFHSIQAGRNLLSQIPAIWLDKVLPDCVDATINLNDETDYRRLLELLDLLKSKLLAHYVAVGLNSESEDIRIAAAEFRE